MATELPSDWSDILKDELEKPYWDGLQRYVAGERSAHDVYPSEENVYAAFALTPFKQVRVVILGQDPYFKPGQATGLAFSVPEGIKPPPSLRTILSELHADLGVTGHCDLSGWARQGVLLLNAVLTVRGGSPHSHQGQGWEDFTNAVICKISERRDRVVFVLWGQAARNKKQLIDVSRHAVIEGAHPRARANALKPLQGSKPFSQINSLISGKPIDWSRA